ncbi:MAG: hypothetical protein ACTSRJ_02270, partial [Candidatus Hodarchaeales archaeon]
VEGLVLSLSLDFRFPQTSEIDVPRTYIGSTGDEMSSDIPKLEVLLIRSGDVFLPSSEVLKPEDRIIVYYYSNFDMKRTNRVVTELPYKRKKKNEITESKDIGKKSIPEIKLNEEEQNNSPSKLSEEEVNSEEKL